MTEYTDALHMTTAAVAALERDLPDWLEGCTDPQGLDVAELLAGIRDQRVKLQALEGMAEEACAKALLDDMTTTDTLRIERHRTTDRKAWDHDAWKRDVRQKALQAVGLKGAQGVLSADGEVLPAESLFDLMATLQNAHGSTAPKTTALRALGLDARDYAECSPGRWVVKVTRMAQEVDGAAS